MAKRLRGHHLTPRLRESVWQYHVKHPTVSYRAIGRIFRISHEGVRKIITRRKDGQHEQS